MHSHFFHWHKRAEFTPDPSILTPRWEAAEKLAANLPATDLASLLNVVLFPGTDTAYVGKLSEEIVKLEPTFEPTGNAELVRVMATAAAYAMMESSSGKADTVALGLQAAAFPPDRVEPVCTEIMVRAAEYLGQESERVRPEIRSNDDEDKLTELDDLLTAQTVETTDGASTIIAQNVINIGESVERLIEENQFLWWLVGKQSPVCKSRREKLKPDAYALVAAVEAEDRVILMPPAASVEALIDDAVLQCGVGKNADRSLAHYAAESATALGKTDAQSPAVSQLTPINSVRAELASGGNVDKGFLKSLKLSPKLEVPAEIAARQYFHELVFLRALRELIVHA